MSVLLVKHVEAKLYGESKVIQRCFDDNNDDDKGDNKKPKRMSSRLSQEHFQNQEKFEFKIKFQDSRIKNKQVEDSRIKKRLNQDK